MDLRTGLINRPWLCVHRGEADAIARRMPSSPTNQNLWSETECQEYTCADNYRGYRGSVRRIAAVCGRVSQLGRVSIVHTGKQYRLYTADGEMKAEAIGALLYRAQSAEELPAVGESAVDGQRTGPAKAMIHDAVFPQD